MSGHESVVRFRIRYGETDRMGTFDNARALEWFECGRTAFLREAGLTYSEVEDRGVFLPVVEAHLKYLGRATYDDLLEMTTSADMCGRARLRCDVRIVHAGDGRAVIEGHTLHAFVDASGRPMRPPEWFVEALAKANAPG